ncbi:hypothetical protein PAXRUDRAFT_596691 [Paxillus rubicundulus Ve08.2h10]|uniref:Uncharacterized protein n=1 Tax=Paxillus rubicundulus Ve08.2h10 TaxID=930991 RepID=A0A0D0DTR7_9AGAM|nr:hypothetical protein PAXRUDRAFT_596691 [Paxillus rubicundulus Ve08.2h10]
MFLPGPQSTAQWATCRLSIYSLARLESWHHLELVQLPVDRERTLCKHRERGNLLLAQMQDSLSQASMKSHHAPSRRPPAPLGSVLCDGQRSTDLRVPIVPATSFRCPLCLG